MISSKEDMERAALRFGMLPFFKNNIPGFSIEEMAEPGMLFGGNDDYGCWEWKGPVILRQTTAYGKFFRRKAGFISLELLPDFLNYRRSKYPVDKDSAEEMILEMIQAREGMTSTELRKAIFPLAGKGIDTAPAAKPKRHSLEGPLQRLQMSGRLLIADFEYKLTSRGERYGWGVALYSTPEIWFGPLFRFPQRTPEESFIFLVNVLASRIPSASRASIAKLIE